MRELMYAYTHVAAGRAIRWWFSQAPVRTEVRALMSLSTSKVLTLSDSLG